MAAGEHGAGTLMAGDDINHGLVGDPMRSVPPPVQFGESELTAPVQTPTQRFRIDDSTGVFIANAQPASHARHRVEPGQPICMGARFTRRDFCPRLRRHDRRPLRQRGHPL
jgi:hypothetical protein